MSPARSVPSRSRRARLASGKGRRTTAVGSPRGRPRCLCDQLRLPWCPCPLEFLLQKFIAQEFTQTARGISAVRSMRSSAPRLTLLRARAAAPPLCNAPRSELPGQIGPDSGAKHAHIAPPTVFHLFHNFPVPRRTASCLELRKSFVGALERRRIFTQTCVAGELIRAASQPFWKEVNTQKSKSPPVAGRASGTRPGISKPCWKTRFPKISAVVKWKPCFR